MMPCQIHTRVLDGHLFAFQINVLGQNPLNKKHKQSTERALWRLWGCKICHSYQSWATYLLSHCWAFRELGREGRTKYGGRFEGRGVIGCCGRVRVWGLNPEGGIFQRARKKTKRERGGGWGLNGEKKRSELPFLVEVQARGRGVAEKLCSASTNSI